MAKINFLLAALSMLIFVSPNRAQQNDPITIGFKTTLTSSILGEERPLWIHLPDSYSENPDQAYPVIYLLDGDGHIHHTSGSMQFLARNQRMPEMIIVAIPNTADRTHDLTPTTTADKERMPTAGGADQMLQFMNEELFPYIEKEYRTTAYRTLIGHSFGGLFAVHALVNHPELFNAYLAISPSLWWDDQDLVFQAEEAFPTIPDLDAKLYMTLGNEGGTMFGGCMKFVGVLKENAPKNLDWHFELMETETHGSVPHRSTYDGLEWLFSDYVLKNDGAELFKAGRIDAIQARFDRNHELYGVPKRTPDHNMLLRLGYSLLNDKLIDLSIEAFEEIARQFPTSYEAHHGLGVAYKVQKDNDKAIANFKTSLELHPGNSEAIKLLKELGAEYETPIFKVTPEVLAAYVGQYEAQPGMTIDITLEDNKLFGQPAGQQKLQLFPLAEHQFYLNDENIQVTFSTSTSKEIDTITVVMNGGSQKIVGKKK